MNQILFTDGISSRRISVIPLGNGKRMLYDPTRGAEVATSESQAIRADPYREINSRNPCDSFKRIPLDFKVRFYSFISLGYLNAHPILNKRY